MLGYVANFFKTSKSHQQFWRERKIDWHKDYLSTWNHPHRQVISFLLGRFKWGALYEVGCGGGANLVNILKHFKNRQVGGSDINPDAVELARNTFAGGHFNVGSAEDIMMSDNSTDVVLSDMCLIYLKNPSKALKEFHRITRHYLLLSELHSSNWSARMKLRLTSGYFAHDYKKLLEKHGFFNIELIKMTEEMWPGGNPQKTYGYFILAQKAHHHE